MTTEGIVRPPRRAAPPLPTGEIALDPPPAIPEPTGARWQQWLMIVPMLAGTGATALMFGGREGAGAYTYVVGAIFGLSSLGMLVLNWGGSGGPRKAELMQARRAYLRHLSGARRLVRDSRSEQQTALLYRHPEPSVLCWEAGGARLWERRRSDGDFAVVRVGVGPQSLATPLVAPAIDATADLEPVTAGALRRFLSAYSVVPDLPISVALRSFPTVIIRTSAGVSTSDGARGLVRAVICQLATFHAPDDLVIAACVAPDRRRDWEWLKWLPHALHPSEYDAAGPRRLVGSSLEELDTLLASLVDKRPRFAAAAPSRGTGVELRGFETKPADPPVAHVVVVVDGGDLASTHLGVAGGLAGTTLLHVDDAADRNGLTLVIGSGGALRRGTGDEQADVGMADSLSAIEAEILARRLAPLRLRSSERSQAPLAADQDLAQLLGIDLASTDANRLWQPRSARDQLRIPIGTAPDGSRVDLDIKEAAQDGMGPHGLVVGATGSGKSELLRTLVLGLAATHSSEALNVVLVDFKGGATFASLDQLPHTAAVITNLADELPLVDRMNDALSGELNRRQELLRKAGPFASLRDYNLARSAGRDLPALPALLVVCDEFTELLTAKPDFIDLFLQIGRVGRSLGVHLVLATQRLEEGRLRGLESHLAYRIALRTFSPGESRLALGVPDAAELPHSPGHGYLRVGTEPLRRFKAAYVSGPYNPASTSDAHGTALRVHAYTTEYAPSVFGTEPAATPRRPGRTLLETMVERLTGQGPSAHPVWLPPLAEAPYLDDLLGPVTVTPARGLAAAQPGGLRVPMAVLDKPYEQRRDVAWLDLSGSAGHVAVVGSPQSGKSTALRALICALALTHTPREVQVYCLDFGGGSLSTVKGLPHVGGVAGRLDVALVRRTVGEVATLLTDRERHFAASGLDSMATYRASRSIDGVDDGFGDVLLVIDGWTTLRGEFEDLEAIVVDVATRGLSYGIHVVASAARWSDFRAIVRDVFGSRVELRLGDPSESMVNRRSATNVPAGAPGRGLWPDGSHLLTARPATTAVSGPDLVSAIAAAWPSAPAPPVRMLPALLPYAQLLGGGGRPTGDGQSLPIGVAESDLRPVAVDFAVDPHLLAYGDRGCGKSTLLRGLAESIVRRFTPDQARIVLVDYRRSLLGSITTEHLIGYGSDVENATALIDSVAGYMHRRRPGPDVTPQQLRDRSWWTGPECFVLVDDYDLVTAGSVNPLLPLLEFLAQARDVGLHLVVARRAGGAGRAQYEPILQRLRELGTPGLVMAGDRDEGALVGTVRPGPQPAGRGWLVNRRDGARLIQVAYLAPAGDPV